MQPTPPPRIPANELRPRRHWYATAAAIAAALTVLAVAIGVRQFHDVVDAVDTDHQFANGDTIILRLDPDDPKAIWLKDPGPWYGSECDITGPGDPGLTDPGIDFFLTYDETWNPFYNIDVSQAGEYAITCTSDEPGRYAIGDPGGFFAFAGWVILAILLAGFGVIVCAVIVIVTAVRRSAHRKRLLAARRDSAARPAPSGARTTPPSA
jgi:hypothetical protein